MSLLDSPAIVALITVSGSAVSTLGAIVLNRKANNGGDSETIRQLKAEIESLKSDILDP